MSKLLTHVSILSLIGAVGCSDTSSAANAAEGAGSGGGGAGGQTPMPAGAGAGAPSTGARLSRSGARRGTTA